MDARVAFDTTAFGSWAVIQTSLPLLRASRHARIVNVSSGAGSLNALTSALAREVAGSGVLVNAGCPGFTATFPGGEAKRAPLGNERPREAHLGDWSDPDFSDT